MKWLYWAFVVAAVIHIFEEYVYPGGFIDMMCQTNPRFAPFITIKFSVIINGLFVLLCIAGAIMANRWLLFNLSIASLLGVNACLHIMVTIIRKRYAPGVVSSIALYLPLSLSAYYAASHAGQLLLQTGVLSVVLGILYNLIPAAYLALSNVLKQHRLT